MENCPFDHSLIRLLWYKIIMSFLSFEIVVMELTEHSSSGMKCYFKGTCEAAQETITDLDSNTSSFFAWETTLPIIECFAESKGSVVYKECRTRLFQYQVM